MVTFWGKVIFWGDKYITFMGQLSLYQIHQKIMAWARLPPSGNGRISEAPVIASPPLPLVIPIHPFCWNQPSLKQCNIFKRQPCLLYKLIKWGNVVSLSVFSALWLTSFDQGRHTHLLSFGFWTHFKSDTFCYCNASQIIMQDKPWFGIPKQLPLIRRVCNVQL